MGNSPFSLGDIPNPVKWKERWPKGQSYEPTAHDIARQERRRMVDGIFINCRHHREEDSRHFCAKHGLITACECFTCPQCDGNMAPEVSKRKVGIVIYRIEAKACVQCGARFEGKAEPVRPKKRVEQTDSRFPPHCSVADCKRRTWEGITFDGHLICYHHACKLEHWRARGAIPEEVPLIEKGEVLAENPKYDLRRATARKGTVDA